ncbi:43072_t:CDS:2 [Gigaspora margarita]|uniref:43072_t:CDS:1 n=1 Tax=Gigaspora margarita TaxID=4874 RepID=A0ABM8VWH0_GIGMA|nr:43072_t:CDS:2 [Gigaspora margarita]
MSSRKNESKHDFEIITKANDTNKNIEENKDIDNIVNDSST